jgi:hypothetical protein
MSYNQLQSAIRDMPKNSKALHHFLGSRLPLNASFEEITRLEYMILKDLILYRHSTRSHDRTSTEPRGKQGANNKTAKRPRPFSSDSESSESGPYTSGIGWAFAQGDDVEDEWAEWEVVRKEPKSNKKARDNKRQRLSSSSSSSFSEDDFQPASKGIGLLFSTLDEDDEMYLDQKVPNSSSRDTGSVKVGQRLRRGIDLKLAYSESSDKEENTPVISQPAAVPVARNRRVRQRQEPIVISASSSSSSSSSSDSEEEDPPYVFNFERLKNSIDPVLLPEYIEPMKRRLEDLEKYEFIELQDSPTSLPTVLTRSVQRYLNATSQ